MSTMLYSCLPDACKTYSAMHRLSKITDLAHVHSAGATDTVSQPLLLQCAAQMSACYPRCRATYILQTVRQTARQPSERYVEIAAVVV